MRLLFVFFILSLLLSNDVLAAKGGKPGADSGGSGGGRKVKDTTAPILVVPDTISVEALSTTGIVVNYTVSATDDVDSSPTVICSPNSGSTFPVGTSSVACQAQDNRGNTSTAAFLVEVVYVAPPVEQDTMAPVIIVPEPLTLEASSADGTGVNYSVTVSDNVDQSPSVSCLPTSGSLFSLGDTLVKCQAQDKNQNSSSASFTIHVVDTTPPSLSLPSAIVSETNQENGIAIDYTAKAVDLVDGIVEVACQPAAGQIFIVGQTIVQCESIDSKGNHVAGNFSVEVVLVSGQQLPTATLPTITLTWTAPTTRADGSSLAANELGGYYIYIVAEKSGNDQVIDIADGSVTNYIFQPSTADTYFFSISSYDQQGLKSELSEVVSATIN